MPNMHYEAKKNSLSSNRELARFTIARTHILNFLTHGVGRIGFLSLLDVRGWRRFLGAGYTDNLSVRIFVLTRGEKVLALALI